MQSSSTVICSTWVKTKEGGETADYAKKIVNKPGTDVKMYLIFPQRPDG